MSISFQNYKKPIDFMGLIVLVISNFLWAMANYIYTNGFGDLMEINLRKMKKNQIGAVLRIEGTGEISRRIRDMGVVPGVDIKIVGRAPLYDPVAIKVRETVLTLRNNEADYIFVTVED